MFRRDVMVHECNAPLATRKRAEPVAAKNQGLAFVVVEREDGSRSGETAPGRSRGRREQQRRRGRTKPLASLTYFLTNYGSPRPFSGRQSRNGSALSLPVQCKQTPGRLTLALTERDGRGASVTSASAAVNVSYAKQASVCAHELGRVGLILCFTIARRGEMSWV